jgi:recombination protein RecA
MNTRNWNKFIEKFDKTFGADTLKKVVDLPDYEVIPTGVLSLDWALGVGGYVEGRLTEVWGPDALGKTTLALLGMAEAQKKYPDKMVGFIDMEQTFDRELARRLGLDDEHTVVYTPDSAEAVADAMKMMITSDEFSMIVLDSIGAMIPEAEKEKDADEATVALQAKIVTRMVKIAAAEAPKNGVAIIFINQVRSNVGGYGPETTTGGGWALKHATTHKIRIKRTGTSVYTVKVDGIKEPVPVGHELALVIERNKVASPRKVATFSLFYEPTEKYGPVGVDRVDEAFVIGSRPDIAAIKRSGNTYHLPDGSNHVGREKTIDYLRSAPEVVEQIRDTVLQSVADDVIQDGTIPDLEEEEILDGA